MCDRVKLKMFSVSSKTEIFIHRYTRKILDWHSYNIYFDILWLQLYFDMDKNLSSQARWCRLRYHLAIFFHFTEKGCTNMSNPPPKFSDVSNTMEDKEKPNPRNVKGLIPVHLVCSNDHICQSVRLTVAPGSHLIGSSLMIYIQHLWKRG